MDQGGLKRTGNRDNSLTFGEARVEVGRDKGDTAGSLLQSSMHLPGPGSLPQPTVAPNGRSGTKVQGEFGGLFEPPQHDVLSDSSDIKEVETSRMQKQQDIGMFSIEDNLPLWNQTICDLDQMSTSIINTSASSVLGNLPLPDLFPHHIKQEGNFSVDKDLGTYSGHAGAGTCDLDANSNRLIEDTEIWQDLDLSSSLPEISDFELDSEVAHLDNILQDSGGGGGGSDSGFVKETKSLVGNGGNCSSVNGTDEQHQPLHHHQQQQHLLQHQQHQLHHQRQPAPLLLSSVMIKEEKDLDDSFIHLRTPGVVKQEKEDSAAFCQSQCLQSSMSSLHRGGAMPTTIGVSAGPSYQYRATQSSRVGLQDQKPFGMYSSLPPAGESWARGSRYEESSGMQRGDNGLPSTSTLNAFSVSKVIICVISQNGGCSMVMFNEMERSPEKVVYMQHCGNEKYLVDTPCFNVNLKTALGMYLLVYELLCHHGLNGQIPRCCVVNVG